MLKRLLLLVAVLILLLMRTSLAQINRIKSREQFRATAYRDGSTNGTPRYSIGYGHQIQPHEQSLMSKTIKESEAVTLLQGDLMPLESQLNRVTVSPFNQNQFDGMIDFGFNCGSGALSKVIATYQRNPHDTKAVTDQMLLYNKTHNNRTNALEFSQELANRRSQEVSIFNTPISATKMALYAGIGLAVAYMAFS
jgi:GH24 family phage-related lysozyme (muramidase)